MRVVPVNQLSDNYAYLVIDESAGVAGVVDVAEAGPVIEAARSEEVEIVAILATHHHFDHVGGNADLIAASGASRLRVYGHHEDASNIPGITDALEDGDTLAEGSLAARAIFIPAHPRGHLAYYFEDHGAVFTGDTLFAGGCGRLFEGDAPQMKGSLEKLAALPDATQVYCGHEYTRSNLAFAATLEPGNRELETRRAEVEALLGAGKPSIPTTIAIEKATNPFLRSASAELRASVASQTGNSALVDGEDVDVFAATRSLKDSF